jgi:hypothetical protein
MWAAATAEFPMARQATSARPGPLANAVNNQWIAVVAVGTISAQPVDLVAANPEMIQRIWAITASAASADIVAEYTVNNQGIWCGEHSRHLADVVIGYDVKKRIGGVSSTWREFWGNAIKYDVM